MSQNKKSPITLFIVLLFSILTSCSPQPVYFPEPLLDSTSFRKQEGHDIAKEEEKKITRPRFESISQLVDTEYDIVQPSPLIADIGESYIINVDMLPLHQFIHEAMGKILKVPYVLGAGVANRKEPISLHLVESVPGERFFAIIKETLALHDLVIQRGEAGYIVNTKDKLRSAIPTIIPRGHNVAHATGRVMTVIPLYHASPSEVILYANRFLETGTVGGLFLNQRLNAIVVMGASERVVLMQQIVELVDRPFNDKRILELVNPIYLSGAELIESLQPVLMADGVQLADETHPNGLLLINIPNISSILVASPNKEWIATLQFWVGKLDNVVAAGEKLRSYSYPVKHRDVETVGAILQSFLGSETETESKAAATGSTISTSTTATDTGQTGAEKGEQVSRAFGSSKLQVIIDSDRNSLIIRTTAAKYRELVELLEQIDKLSKQVLLEMTIAEITLKDEEQLGVEWEMTGVGFNLDTVGQGVLSTLGGMGLGTAGLSYTLQDESGNIRAKLNAFAKDDRLNIVSRPHMLVLNRKEVSINIGQEIPVLTGQKVDSGSGDGILQSTDYTDTGLIINVIPTILEGNLVHLDLRQELSQGQSNDVSNIDSPIIVNRIIETELLAKSGELIMIGGLISKVDSWTEFKVPILGDIPYLGAFFKSVSQSTDTTELVILIVPHIIHDSSEIRELTEKFSGKLRLIK